MPDYTKQLDEIVRILSRPGISPWLLSAFSVFVGIIGGAVGRAIEPWGIDFSRRFRMRRVLYRDITNLFFQVETINTFGEPYADDGVRDDAFARLVNSLDFEAEDYIKTNRDVFMQLDEHLAVKHIFQMLHRIVNDGPAQMVNNCRQIPWMLGFYIHDESLSQLRFQCFFVRETVRSADEAVTENLRRID